MPHFTTKDEEESRSLLSHSKPPKLEISTLRFFPSTTVFAIFRTSTSATPSMAFLLSHVSSPSFHLLNTTHRSSNHKFPTINLSTITNIQSPPPTLRDSQLKNAGSGGSDVGGGSGDDRKNEFYLNLGMAVRTLREDMPALFVRDLNYEIYRDDIAFTDPLNSFQGIENYRVIFWALRFHGRILFREIKLEVLRIWQPSENVILIRWNLRGVPRVPWEAQGQFQGTSRYKLDRNGKIYEHKVDNLEFNFPRVEMRPVTMLDLVLSGATYPASPNLSFLGNSSNEEACPTTWLELYRSVKKTLEQEGSIISGSHDQLLLTC